MRAGPLARPRPPAGPMRARAPPPAARSSSRPPSSSAAFSTGLAVPLLPALPRRSLVVGGSYLVTRFGLADLEAGYAVDQLQAHVGDQLRATYTLRNTSRLPEALAGGPQPVDAARRRSRAGRSRWGRAASVRGSPGCRSTRRGHFRIDPLADPDGRSVRVLRGDRRGRPRADRSSSTRASSRSRAGASSRRAWRAAARRPVRTQQTTPLATTVRPVRAGRRVQPDPLANDRAAPARSRSRSSTWSRPPTCGSSWTSSAPRRSGAATRPPSRSACGSAAADRGAGDRREPGRGAHDDRAPRSRPAAGPRPAPAPEDPPAARRRRRRRRHAARRGAPRRAARPPPGDVRGHRHAVGRPGLGPPARHAPPARDRLPGGLARSRGLRSAGRPISTDWPATRRWRTALARAAGRLPGLAPPRPRRVRHPDLRRPARASARRGPRRMTAARTAFDLGAPPPARPDGRTIAARSGRGLVQPAPAGPHGGARRLGDRRRALGPGRRAADGLPAVGGARRRPVRASWRPRWAGAASPRISSARVLPPLFLGLAVGAQLAPGGTLARPVRQRPARRSWAPGTTWSSCGRGTTTEIGHFLLRPRRPRAGGPASSPPTRRSRIAAR